MTKDARMRTGGRQSPALRKRWNQDIGLVRTLKDPGKRRGMILRNQGARNRIKRADLKQADSIPDMAGGLNPNGGR